MLTVVGNDDLHVKSVLEKTLSDLKKTGDFEISVSVVSGAEMLQLHDHKYHDVLSYPTEDGPGPDGIIRLGDIVVCEDNLNNLDFLLDHACRHLLGIHHE